MLSSQIKGFIPSHSCSKPCVIFTGHNPFNTTHSSPDNLSTFTSYFYLSLTCAPGNLNFLALPVYTHCFPPLGLPEMLVFLPLMPIPTCSMSSYRLRSSSVDGSVLRYPSLLVVPPPELVYLPLNSLKSHLIAFLCAFLMALTIFYPVVKEYALPLFLGCKPLRQDLCTIHLRTSHNSSVY